MIHPSIQKYLLLAIACIILSKGMPGYSQQQSFTLLSAGNLAGQPVDTLLVGKWRELAQDNTASAFLFPGNLYDATKNNFPTQLFDGFRLPLLLAPGKSEWDNGKPDGKEVIKEVEEALKKLYQGEVFLPQPACPGPEEVVLNDHLVVILLDTWWWVHKHDRRYNKCGIESDADILILIQDAIRRHYPARHVVIAGHQPLMSYGNSGGYFSCKQSLLEAPYTFYRKALGTPSDNNYPEFKPFRNAMLSMMENYPGIIYLSSGENNLQYFKHHGVHHIVTGSMVHQGFIHPELVQFGTSHRGFARLLFSPTGESTLEFYGTDGVLFHRQLYKKEIKSKAEKPFNRQFPDSMVSKASEQYNIPPSRYFWLGKNYRDVWNTEIKAPVFDIVTEKGGLYVVKRGGGQQTKSIRLEDKKKRQYVLRSIEKYAEGALPVNMKNTFAVDLVQDQISASNPYAAPVVARLAHYAGIFHTNPVVVYMPDDPLLGIYRRDVANQLFLFEERPDGNREDVPSFGRSKNIISTAKVVKATLEKKDHLIDADATLRARLFDLWINDWDRHDDQWRWAAFSEDGRTIYKPIPRDRDQAFFTNEGLIPWIAARKWLLPKIQGFDEYTENVPGQSFNARFFDRSFLTSSDWDQWLRQIDSLKILLTPSRVDSAMTAFPKEVQPLCAPQTGHILKARLENLKPMAHQLYLSLAKEVDITGTNEDDNFQLIALNDTTLQVTLHSEQGRESTSTAVYNRVFYASETNKVRIYGFDGDDVFTIKGVAVNKIKVSIIGGGDNNRVIYQGSEVPRFITIYDEKETTLSPSLRPRLKCRYDREAVKYNREAYEVDVVLPGVFTGYNRDDGVFVGGGPIINKYSRYRRQQYKLLGNYALLTNSVSFHLSGTFFYPLKNLEVNVLADVKAPRYVDNYFGMGNNSSWQSGHSNIDYYLVRMTQYVVATDFSKQIDRNEAQKIGLGLFYKNTNAEETDDRFITDIPANGLDENALKMHEYAGVSLSYRINTVSNREMKTEEEFEGSQTFPTRGIRFDATLLQFIGLNDLSPGFTKASADFSTYLSFAQRPRVVYAFRVGGEKNFGDYVFHEAAKLGQKSNLRGFRQTRFYGDASLYQNTDVRIRLKQFKTYVLNGSTGLTLFHDVGRVWLEDESSSRWHRGYGLGLWLSPFDMALLNVSYAHSNEDNLINVTLNYQF